MDMVNDGKDTRLDTPQAVKEALASGKDLYNPETGEFWWKYNDTGSIANTYIYLDDPNLLAVIDNPDFDLFEDIVGWLNYTGRIADSPDYYAENADDYPDAPDYDERDAVFAQIASEDGWVVATPENVRAAVQSHMAEHGGEAPGKENGMDKAAEIAAWKENHVPIDRIGETHLYGFDATEPGSFDRAIECHQLHSTRGMPGDDRITLGGEAQAMKVASAEMADGAGKHDIGLETR